MPVQFLSGGNSGDYPLVGHHNVVTASNIATTTDEDDNPASNLSNPSTSLKWRGTTVGSDEYITITTTSLGTLNYVAVAKHNWATSVITVSLEGDTGGGYSTIGSTFVPANDGPLIMKFAPLSTYVGLRIKLASGGLVVPEAAVVYVGQLLLLQRKLYVGHDPITMARETNSVSAMAESGEFLGRIILGQYSTSEISLQNLTPDWVRTYLDPWLEDALEDPFFFAWRPVAYPNETAFAWVPSGSTPRPGNQRSNGMMQITVPLAGITT
jgi:hypothetical protein